MEWRLAEISSASRMKNRCDMNLSERSCVPDTEGAPALSADRARELLLELPGWTIVTEEPKLRRQFKFRDFPSAMEFVRKVAEIAEEQDHHPDIHVHYDRVALELWTHAIGGLSENDFILAAKINSFAPREKK